VQLSNSQSTARESADQHKNEAERTKTAFDEFKAKHDTEFAQARKHAAGLQRDKSDLQSALDTLKVEVVKANRRLGPKFGSPLIPGTSLLPLTRTTCSLPEVYPRTRNARTPLLYSSQSRFSTTLLMFPPMHPLHVLSAHPITPTKEIEALQQRLFHAERQIKTLKDSLHREKETFCPLHQVRHK
jgi:hypothetical protein